MKREDLDDIKLNISLRPTNPSPRIRRGRQSNARKSQWNDGQSPTSSPIVSPLNCAARTMTSATIN
jgi:hypothetical protein